MKEKLKEVAVARLEARFHQRFIRYDMDEVLLLLFGNVVVGFVCFCTM